MERIKATLEGLPPVEEVAYLPEQELFVVAYNAGESLADRFKQAVEGGVVAPGLRKTLGEIGAFFNS